MDDAPKKRRFRGPGSARSRGRKTPVFAKDVEMKTMQEKIDAVPNENYIIIHVYVPVYIPYKVEFLVE